MPIRLYIFEGSGLNDSVYGKCQAPSGMFLEKRGEAFEQESVVERLFLMGTSENYGDLLTSMTAMAGFEPVGENGAIPRTPCRRAIRSCWCMRPGRILLHLQGDDRGWTPSCASSRGPL